MPVIDCPRTSWKSVAISWAMTEAKLRLAQPWSADKQGVVEPRPVLEGSVHRRRHLGDNPLLPDKMGQGRGNGIVDFRSHGQTLSVKCFALSPFPSPPSPRRRLR